MEVEELDERWWRKVIEEGYSGEGKRQKEDTLEVERWGNIQ